MTWSRPISTWLAPALFLALGVLVILFDAFGLQSALSNRLFDAYQRHAARTVRPSPVRVLDLAAMDEDSLTAVTRSIAGQGARLIVFTAPLQLGPSPQSLSAKLPPGEADARSVLAKLPEPGHDLAQALASLKAIVPVELGSAGRNPAIKARLTWQGTDAPFAPAPRFDSAAASTPLLEANAAGQAAPNLLPDNDGVVRKLPLVFNLNKGLVPGTAAEAVRLVDGRDAITFANDERDPLSFFRGVGIAGLVRGNGLVTSDHDGRIRLHYSAGGVPSLNPDASGSLQGAIVVIGAQGAMVRTPFGPASLASVTGQGIENLLANDVLVRPSWFFLLEALLVAALGAGMLQLLRFGLGWTAAFVFGGCVAMGLGSWFLYSAHNLLADALTPSLALALAFAAAVLAYLQDLRLAHAALRLAFADSLPRGAIEKIARQPQLLNIDGERRNVTYLVCGVRGLTRLAAAYNDDARDFTALMQRVLTPLIDQALAHGGTIDRLTADGFAAFWNAPLDDSDHALHACEAANGMAIMAARVSEQLAQDYRGEGIPPLIEIGIGVATGSVIAGSFGGAGRVGYSVQGDAVTLAGRIQAMSEGYGPALVVAEETRQQAERGFAFLEIDTIADVKGPVKLYAIMGNPVSKASPKFRALTVFHDHIFQAIRKQQWNMARELIAQCRRLSGASQRLYDLQLTRIAWHESHPPGADWDGAFRLPIE